MLESAGARLALRARQVARLSLALLAVGPSILLVYAWVEVLNNPGLSLADGYSIGRTPWTPIGLVVALAGGVGGLRSGSLAIAIDGGWWRRFLLLPAFAGAVLWWSIALGLLPFPRFLGPDPVTYAYSLPATAGLLVLMPAALLATLCITSRMVSVPRTRLRPVHTPGDLSRPADARDDSEELID